MEKSILLTNNGLEVPCIVFPTKRNLFPIGKEVMVYAQNRIAKAYQSDEDDSHVAELGIVVNFCIIPELDEELFESIQEALLWQKNQKNFFKRWKKQSIQWRMTMKVVFRF